MRAAVLSIKPKNFFLVFGLFFFFTSDRGASANGRLWKAWVSQSISGT